ncbi:MAG: family 20 glycosylhydrolase [Pseudomonadales bacterium]|jgi:hexosaminidase|nr:family 20 glycosylhydrolase [Pseudomonadales bacterium]
MTIPLQTLLPQPRTLETGEGPGLGLRDGLRLRCDAQNDTLARVVARAQRRCDALLGVPGAHAAELRVLVPAVTPALPTLDDPEHFSLAIEGGSGALGADTTWGVAHGLERLVQLVHGALTTGELPALRLDDGPRLPWRGLLLDLARHFLGIDALLRTLDGMAALGLNVLHLHLNDDQGFAVESRRQPLLNARSSTHGMLRAEDVGRLVAAAAERAIRVVPELDVPGHAGALLWARPELAAGPPPQRLPRRFGPSRHALDPTLDETWVLLDDLLDDLVELFPDAWLHLGGDEVHAEVYAFGDARRQAWMRARGLSDAAQVQAWFTSELADRAGRRGRRVVGWDEVLHPEVPPTLVVQSWRGAATLETALAAGHDALFSSGWYLDLFYPARLHYGFDPTAGAADLAAAEQTVLDDPSLAPVRDGIAGLLRQAGAARSGSDPGVARGRILGGEACLWGELVTEALLDVRLYGRLAAVAERLWSPPESCAASDFMTRLPCFLAQLEGTTACRPLSGSIPGLFRLGVAPRELPQVLAFLALLEPVRWYRRLLGPAGLSARLAGEDAAQRPRDADTPLGRPADLIAPESLYLCHLERRLAEGAPVDWLLDEAAQWRLLPRALAALMARSPDFAALRPLVDALPGLADAAVRWVEAGAPASHPVLETRVPVPEAAELELALQRVLCATPGRDR